MSEPEFLISAIAGQRLDEIFCYTSESWGDAQAETYIRNLFAFFTRVARREVLWRPIPVEFGIEGFYGRCEHHYVYWRRLGDGRVGIVTILHERMHQIRRFQDDAES